MEELSIDDQTSLHYVLEKGLRAGYALISMSNSQLYKQIDPVSKVIKGFKQSIVSMRLVDQNIITVTNRPIRESLLEEQEHYYVADGLASKMKVLMV